MPSSRFDGGRIPAFLLLCVLTLGPVSCQRKTTVPRPTIEYVREILAHRSSDVYKTVAAYDPKSVAGPICLVGEPARCLLIGEVLMACDEVDNVTGSRTPDGLPDFAGETVLSVLDQANVPYGGFLEASNTAFLRELAVRHVVDCLDTVSFISAYDKEGMGRRDPAKLIVFVSPYQAAYGRFDADTLFTCLGIGSPVLSAVDLLFDRALSRDGGKAVNIGIIADSTVLRSGVYDAVFEEKVREYSAKGSILVHGSGNSLTAFLDAYEQAGYTKPLSALLVDDLTVDVDSLQKALSGIRVEFSDESLRYGKLVAPDFGIFETSRCVADKLYSHLRSTNTFTHNIAYPKADALICAPRTDLPVSCYGADGGFAPDYKYTRTPVSEIPTTMLLQYGSRYLPESVMDILRNQTPKTYRSYVQD
ncbi:MAG: hypothetical protein IJ799_02075 [Bacteroidales bacterium]|nr:hypothetical protein [Bacteroidales bacterium]